jgi:hypothetical protein
VNRLSSKQPRLSQPGRLDSNPPNNSKCCAFCYHDQHALDHWLFLVEQPAVHGGLADTEAVDPAHDKKVTDHILKLDIIDLTLGSNIIIENQDTGDRVLVLVHYHHSVDDG